MATANDLLLAAVKNRGRKQTEFAYGILSADVYVRTMQEAIGLDKCYQAFSRGSTSFDDAVKRAARTLVYSNPEMELEEATANAGQFKRLMRESPSGVELPKNALIVFRHKLTSSRKDRDGDTLHSDGAAIDPKMLLLWQHVHTAPLGPYLYTASQDDKSLRVVSAIIDMNELCHDAAVMVDNGMGRFSHGFRAVDFTETKADRNGNGGGFDVKKFEVMEESLVSVPANVDAETEEVLLSLVEGGKLTSGVMKSYGRSIRDHRSIQVPVKLDLKVMVNGQELGGSKNENEPGNRTVEGETGRGEDEAGAPEETDVGAKDEDVEEQKAADTKMNAVAAPSSPSQLSNSWEAVRDVLSSSLRRYLLGMGISLAENEYPWLIGTFNDYVIVAIDRAGKRDYFKIGWETKYDAPVLVGQPEAVEIETTTEIVGKAIQEWEKSFVPPDAKPLPNEHAARQTDPDKYDKIRRQNNKFGEGIHAVWGVTEDGKTELQSVHFDAGKFTAEEAKKWLDEHEYKTSSFEEAKKPEEKTMNTEKQGRVLSKANETKISDAMDDINEAAGMEGTSRPCRALLKSATGSLREVLNSLGEMEGQKELAVKEAISVLLVQASGDDRRRAMEAMMAIENSKQRKQIVEQYRALLVR